MGPRRSQRGRRNHSKPTFRRYYRFNGATPITAWKTWQASMAVSPDDTLQWGHADHSVEDIRSPSCGPASSALLQWGHADHSVEDACQVPPGEPLRDRLQWGHADHSVEDSRPTTESRERQLGFNGATPITAWKTPKTIVDRGLELAASMGPRRSQRGRRLDCRARRSPQTIASMGPRRSQRGRHGRARRPDRTALSLQWGHADDSVEDVLANCLEAVDVSCFNGATPITAWKT